MRVAADVSPLKPLVFIIIPIHNGLENTIKCLTHIRDLDYGNFRTVVVDDGSQDGSYEYINSHFPEVMLLKGKGQWWWSGSVNRGIEHARRHQADYVCLLNNDNTFERNFLTVLVETARQEDVACVCSKVHKEVSGTVFFGGGGRNRWGELLMGNDKDNPSIKVLSDCQWAGGMGVVIRADIFDEVGLFAEKRFPHYFGDADFYFRLREKGERILFQPDSIVYNDTGSTGYSYRTGKVKDLFAALFSRKSHLNIWATAKFYYLYSRKYVLFIMVKRISRIFGGYLRALFRRGGISGQKRHESTDI